MGAGLGGQGSAVIGVAGQAGIDIIDCGVGAVLGVELKALMLADKAADLTVRVIQIAKGQGAGLAGIDAGRGSLAVQAGFEAFGQSGIDALQAEIALFGSAHLVGVELAAFLFKLGLAVAGEVAGVLVFGQEGAVLVRAGDDAVAAADALVLVHLDDTVRAFDSRLSGADLHTGGLLTLIAAHGHGGDIGAVGGLHLPGNQAGPGDVQRQEMLNAAGCHTGVTTGAFGYIDYHSPSHFLFHLLSSQNNLMLIKNIIYINTTVDMIFTCIVQCCK